MDNFSLQADYHFPAHILVVDDEYENIRLVGQTLMDEGMTFSYATNGQEAIKLARSKDFDLILLDIMMPGMDGYEVCKFLRGCNESYNIPVIFLTAKPGWEDVVRGFDAGAQDYIHKPFHQKELTSRVKTQVELYRQRQILMKMNTHMTEIIHDKDNLINNQRGELTQETLNLGQKNEMIDTLRKEMENIIKNDLRTLQNKLNDYLEHLVDARGSSEKWQSFDRQYHLYHSDMINQLITLCPDLSPLEIRICAFLMNGLNTKDISSTMRISMRGVEQARYRIRKKLAIKSHTSIVNFLVAALNNNGLPH